MHSYHLARVWRVLISIKNLQRQVNYPSDGRGFLLQRPDPVSTGSEGRPNHVHQLSQPCRHHKYAEKDKLIGSHPLELKLDIDINPEIPKDKDFKRRG